MEELLKNSAYATLLTRGDDPRGLQHFPVTITLGSNNQQAEHRAGSSELTSCAGGGGLKTDEVWRAEGWSVIHLGMKRVF